MTPAHPQLPRVVGLGGAILLGLGSIIGTGVFVTLGIAAGLAGPAVVVAMLLAALLALCNGLSSAQLAAAHPVSGGTYEYGYTYLRPWLGFTAGWMFVCAKTASAATAALGFASYFLSALTEVMPQIAPQFPAAAIASMQQFRIPLAICAVIVLTFIVTAGLRRSNRANTIIVGITLATLLFFVVLCIPRTIRHAHDHFSPFLGGPNADAQNPWPAFAEATALMFVAYTGYGRIATLGEEVHDPRRSIPRALVISLFLSAVIYVCVALAAVGAKGDIFLAEATKETGAPLEAIARSGVVGGPWAGLILAIGAITAMLGVLLNLILGLSRVVMAMGRRGDLPVAFSRLDATGKTPTAAVIFVAVLIGALTLIGNVKTTWSFSAFTVLIYYAITNLAALRMPSEHRRYPRWVAWLGLIGCLSMAYWVEPRVAVIGIDLIVIGLLWHMLTRRAVSH